MVKSKFNIPYSIDAAVLILRVFPSFFMLLHGFQKLSKVFAGDWSFADPIGLGEGLSLSATIFAEVVCSLLVMVGFLTRPALLVLMFVMWVAAFVVHGADPFSDKEHALLFLIVYLAIFVTGPGRLSMDFRVFNK